MQNSKDPTEPLPVAIYARISRDRTGGGLGVDRQQADCQALADRLGWNVVAIYVDNDISAYSGRERPEYRRMIEDVQKGSVKGVVAWHTDRLHRRTTELEEFVSTAEKHDLQVQTVTSGTVDLTTASGRMIARMLGAAAQHEVDHSRERMKRAKAEMAADGKYRGGPRPYGYEKDGVTIREEEATVIRNATTAILAGRSLGAFARELNNDGFQTSTNREWTYARLKDVLIRPRNAGLLSKGRADRGAAEIVGPANWPAIIEEETWRAVYDMLTDSSRRKQDGNEVKWLGSGIYSCGRCGSPLRPAPYGGTKSRATGRKYLYRCTSSAHLTISARQTDDHVRNLVAELVRDPRVVAAMTPQDEDTTVDRNRRAALVARLATFEDDYASGAITGTQLSKATTMVNAEMKELDDRLASSLRRSATSPIIDAIDPGDAFLTAPVDIQRAVLSSVLTVEVNPQVRRGASWSSNRLLIKLASN